MAMLESPALPDLVGTFRTFGDFGPLYEIIGHEEDGWLLVMVVETGEYLTYPFEQAIRDPEAN